jgi:YidC/Oxa1 family membrane protein insertase
LACSIVKVLKWLNRYFNNFGVAIIVLTILMKLVLFPFSFRGEKGIAKSKENQKKLAYIEQKYKNDPDKLAQERAEFLRKHGLPGLGSCLPMFLQMPVFFALNRVLSSAPEISLHWFF